MFFPDMYHTAPRPTQTGQVFSSLANVALPVASYYVFAVGKCQGAGGSKPVSKPVHKLSAKAQEHACLVDTDGKGKGKDGVEGHGKKGPFP